MKTFFYMFDRHDATLILYLTFWVYFFIAWVWNLVKLFQCDFDPIGKEEILHLVGVVAAPLSMITVWF